MYIDNKTHKHVYSIMKIETSLLNPRRKYPLSDYKSPALLRQGKYSFLHHFECPKM